MGFGGVDLSSSARGRRWRAWAAALVAAIAAVASGVIAPASTAAPASATAPVTAAPPTAHLTVMTRNLYLGADLTPLVTATTPAQVATAVQQILAAVVASNPPLRMSWVADEIAAEHPDVVGLQEAALWQIQTPGGTVTFDFVQLILHALAAQGLHYRVAVEQTNFDSAVQLAGAPLPARFADHDAILVNADDSASRLQVLDTGAAHYAHQLTFPTLLGPIDFERGYVYADVRTSGRVWRAADTHLEAYPGFGTQLHDYTSDQAQELLAALPDQRTTVVLGDLNSRPDNPLAQGYSVLLDHGYSDAWSTVHPADPGLTCCRNDDLSGGALDERIDYVLDRGPVTPLSASVIDVAPRAETAPRWPADHAGLVATVAIGVR